MNPEEAQLRLQYLKETGQHDEAAQFEQYLRETAQHPDTAQPPVAAKPTPPVPAEKSNDISGTVARHLLNAAQGIPGMEMLEAGAGALGSKLTNNPLTYQQSLDTLRDETGKTNGVVSGLEKVAGASLLLPFLPANPVAAGALLGGANEALSADEPLNPVKTAMGAAGGALLGKGADVLVGAGRGLLAASPAKNLLDRAVARAASAKRLYGAAMDEGRNSVTPPAIEAYLKEPDIAEIVSELQSTREYKHLAPNSPEMLDAVYKTLSDRSATIKKGLMSVNPNKPNIGRFQAKDIQAAQNAGLEAMDTTMPTYREAVKDFAQHKAAEDAVSRGYDAVRAKLLNNLPTARNLTRTTPEAFAEWAKNAGQDETKAAVEGILGATKMALKKAPLTKGRKALMVAPSLLRSANDMTAKYLPRAGLLGINASQ